MQISNVATSPYIGKHHENTLHNNVDTWTYLLSFSLLPRQKRSFLHHQLALEASYVYHYRHMRHDQLEISSSTFLVLCCEELSRGVSCVSGLYSSLGHSPTSTATCASSRPSGRTLARSSTLSNSVASRHTSTNSLAFLVWRNVSQKEFAFHWKLALFKMPLSEEYNIYVYIKLYYYNVKL